MGGVVRSPFGEVGADRAAKSSSAVSGTLRSHESGVRAATEGEGCSSLELVPAFTALTEGAKGPKELLEGASKLLGEAFAYSRVLVADCTGNPPVVRETGGIGWGELGTQVVGSAIMSRACFRAWPGSESERASPSGLEIQPLSGGALAELNAALAAVGYLENAGAAVSLWHRRRGHALAAWLVSSEAVRALSPQHRCTLDAIFAILGTALAFMRRKRHYALRLKQVRRAKVAWDGGGDALSATQENLRSAASKLADTQVELEAMRRRHRLVLEHTNAGLLMIAESRVVYCNARFEALLGFSKGELQGADVKDLLLSGCLAPRIVCGTDGEPTPPQGRVCEIMRRDGSSLWLRISEVGFDDSGQRVRFITATNVTEQMVAEQAILASRRELQRLSRSLISSQEDERKRVAGELHDGVGQGLTVVKLMLQNLAADQLEAGDSAVAERLIACVDKSQEMIEEVRRLSMALRPAILDSGGVLLALSRLTREAGEMKRGLAVHMETGVRESEVREDLKIHLFRIAQEALNNVIKHAGASNVWIRLDRTDRGLMLELEDDGVGFDPSGLEAPASGLGLSSMRQRARLHHGVMQIASQPGRGTTLRVFWGMGFPEESGECRGQSRSWSDQPVVEGVGHQVGDSSEAHLAHQAGPVLLDGLGAEGEQSGDLSVLLSLGH